jgi:hypothetical protein
MQHRILIGINTQVGKTMLIFRPALKNECRPEENYSWSAKPAITSTSFILMHLKYFIIQQQTRIKVSKKIPIQRIINFPFQCHLNGNHGF